MKFLRRLKGLVSFLPRPKAAWFQFSLRSMMLFVVVWKGTDPTPASAARGVSKIPVKVDFETDRVKVYLDSPKFPGWNEMDAVGLRYSWGRTIWADSASASSIYGQGSFGDMSITLPFRR